MKGDWSNCRECGVSGQVYFISTDGFCQMSCMEKYYREHPDEMPEYRKPHQQERAKSNIQENGQE